MLRSKRPDQRRPKGGLLVGRRHIKPKNLNKSISAEDLYNIAFGFGISASGGGGSFMQGLEIAQRSIADGFESVDIYEPKELTGTGRAFVSGGIGKPESLQDPIAFGEKVLVLLENLDKYLRRSGSSLQGILPVEAGPINGLLPIYNVHAYNKKQTDPERKIWLFDCDGAGRAVPALTTLMYDYFSEGTCPITYNFKNDAGDTRNILLQSAEVLNGSDAEQVFSSVMLYGDGSMNESIPFTCWQFDEEMAKDGIRFPTGTYRFWKNMGALFKQSYKDKDKLIEFLKVLNFENYYSRHLFQDQIYTSTVDDIVQVPNDRWNVGYIKFDVDADSEKRLYFVNENLTISKLTYKDNKLETLATAPSSITSFFKDPNPDKVPIGTDGTTLEPGFIPYNTGDIDKIAKLKGVEIIIAVTDPTIPSKMNFLYEDDMRSRFLDVMNGTFEQLNAENDEYIFPDLIEEVIPLPPLKDDV
ncbi:uncharacterized protein [Clytia hemisphaerica]|uniref:S-Me-THD N-terminal domain-containing protein n=1 Tax=Clytia hemisphaerica TaxID=252671 RepID=A0A7M5X3N7_9CNID